MNKEASRGNSTNNSWPLDVLFHSVLRFCEKEIMKNINQNLPPLIHKKLFLHTIYQVRVRLSRLFVVYKWNMKQIQLQQTPEYKNSYFSRLQLAVDNLQSTCNYFHRLIAKNINFNFDINLIEKLKIPSKMPVTSKEFFKNRILQTQLHKSVTGVYYYNNKLIVISKDKYQFSVKFGETIKLLCFRIYYSKEIDIEPMIKKIAQNCYYILNNSSSPLYNCCEYLEKVYMYLYFTLICKTLQSYTDYHKFTIINHNGIIILNFHQLRMKFSLILLQTSACIYSNKEQANIRFVIEKAVDIPSILSKIQHYGSIYLFSRFKKRISEWLPLSASFSTSIDVNNCYFYLLIFNHPISKISYNSENNIQCDFPQLLKSLLTRNEVLFFDFIKSQEIQIIAESTGFSNLLLYNAISFKNALNKLKDNKFSSNHLLYLGSTNNFIRKIYNDDKDTILLFKQIIMMTTRRIIYRNLLYELLQNNIYSTLSDKDIVITTDSYDHIKFKIDKNGYWSLKFNQPKLCKNLNTAIMFQDHQIYNRFGSWIQNLLLSVVTTSNIFDQTFFQFKHNKAVSDLHLTQNTSLFFKSVCPFLNSISHPASPILINLQPIKYVGHTTHYEVFETLTSLPTLKFHFVNHPNLDICITNGIEEDLLEPRFGSFLYFFLPVFPHFFHVFQDRDWQIINISLKGTFSLLLQSKYMVNFQQQANNCFIVAIPQIGKSIILNIPLSIFPSLNHQILNPMKKSKTNVRKPQFICVSMSDLVQFRDSILTFFEEQKFLKNYGFNYLFYNSRMNLILNNGNQANQNWIKMNASLGANGLSFDVEDNFSNTAIYSFKKLINVNFSNRLNRIKALGFLFDCLQLEKPTAFGLFQCLQCLLDSNSANIDWEKSFMDSKVDVANCFIEFHLILNNNDYKILIDSSQESNDSDDASVKVIKPNGDVASVQKLKSDLEIWFNFLLNQASSEKVLYEFSFL